MSGLGLEPLGRSRATSDNELFLLDGAERPLVVKVYRGKHAAERRLRELTRLSAWRAAGCTVPAVHDLVVSDLPGPYLVFEYVAGSSLRQRLCSPKFCLTARLELSQAVLHCVRRRHELAVARGDAALIHPDANTGNIILRGDRIVWIDLESPKRATSVLKAAACELGKLMRWMALDLGRGHLPALAERVAAVYAGLPGVPRELVKITHERPFQGWHRWRDRRRKAKAPEAVTKYDVADALRDVGF